MTRLRRSSGPRPGIALMLCVALLAGCAPAPRSAQIEAPAIGDLGAIPDRVETPAAVEEAREKAMAAYRDYLRRYPDAAERLEIMRRLADLLVDSALPATVTDRGRYAEAISLYQYLLDARPKHPDNAAIRYQLARAQEESGQPQRAMDTLDQLIAVHPTSQGALYADTQFRRGELLFGAAAFPEAEAAYREVVRLGEAVAVYDQALYKLGWSRFKQAQYDHALAPFFTLLERALSADSTPDGEAVALSQAEQELVDDLLRVISLSCSYLDGADSLSAHFDTHGRKPYEEQIYRRLAELYTRKELFIDAATTWLALARRHPDDAQSPRYYLAALQLYGQAEAEQKVLQTQRDFVRRYGLATDFWSDRRPQDFADVVTQLQSALIELAGHGHRRVLASGAEDAFQQAEQWYREYLAFFGAAPRAAEINFQLAELLYQRGDYVRAATEYERSAYSRGPHPRAAEAGRSALQAYGRLEVGGHDALAAGTVGRPTLSRIQFARSFPHHPDAPAVLTRAGADLLARGQQREALQVAEALLQTDASVPDPWRQAAWVVVAQAQFQLGDHANSEQGYRQALAVAAPADPRRGVLQEGIALSIYRQAETARSRDSREAAGRFLRAAANAPRQSDLRFRAGFEAAALLLGLAEWGRAVETLQQLSGDYPAHPQRAEVTKKLAFAHLGSGDEAAAAQAYRRLSEEGGERALRREALKAAGDLYRRAGNVKAAKGAFERYVRRYPEPLGVALEVRRQLAELAAARGDEIDRRRWLQEMVITGGGETDENARTLAGQAALVLAEKPVRAFEQVRLVEPLKATLGNKLGAMKRALAALQSAAAFRVEGVTAEASYRIATLYDQLSRALLDSERPTGLSAEEEARYDRLLAQQADPFERQAVDLYRANFQRRGIGSYDLWSEKSRQRLAQLRPDRYAKEERSDPRWLAAHEVAARCGSVVGETPCPGAALPSRRSDAPEGQPARQGDGRTAALIRARRFDEAAGLLASAGSGPELMASVRDLVVGYVRNGDYPAAEALIGRLPLLDAGKSIAYTQLGILLRKAGDIQRARSAYQRALEHDPSYPLVHLNLGILCDLYLQSRECAVEHYREFQRLSAVEDTQVSRWLQDLRPQGPVGEAVGG